MLTPAELAKFRGQPWVNERGGRDARNYRPEPSGHQRDSNYPNVRWLDEQGLVHQASADCNLTLCELFYKDSLLMVRYIVEATEAPTTCIGCISYPSWLTYP